jgi:hypothetical protein
MIGVLIRARVRVAGYAIAGALSALLLLAPGAGAITTSHYTGTTPDGGAWIADVPTPWNGTLILYSHGFGTLLPQDAPDPGTQAALLNMGYALAGSGYNPHGSLWALGSAVHDQFETLGAVERGVLPSKPVHVFALGTSMGGLISGLEDQNSNGRLDGALTTCGIVAGGIQLNNYQLDGEYAMRQLLAAGQHIKLVRFSSFADSAQSAAQLTAVGDQAQTTPQGRARLALAMAFLNVSTWAPGEPMPSPTDYAKQEREQFKDYFVSNPALFFIVSARQQIELAAGGNGSWTYGVNFKQLLERSSYRTEVEALYRAAGLNLDRDLENLTQHADIRADANAIRWLTETSVPTGHLQIPELDLHTISDQLVPVQQENYYLHLVRRAGSDALLRQAYVARQNHCNFTPAELVAGVLTLQRRVETGTWETDPATLEALAKSLHLGDAAFIHYAPPELSGNNGPLRPDQIRPGS